jgi:protein gp37
LTDIKQKTMAQNSKIEWTHHTANLWHGCTKVHLGRDNCYAETLAKRWGNDIWGNDKPRKAIKSVWNDLANYQKLAKEAGEMNRVFVGSMMDIFEKPMRLVDSKGNKIPLDDMDEEGMNTGDLRDEFFSNISSGNYPNLMFLLLTKRPRNINKYIPEDWKENPPANVMFGTSPVNQETADNLILELLKVKGKRFLSIEPQLDRIDIWKYLNRTVHLPGDDGRIDWVIQGGESGHHKRPFDLSWAYSMKKDCSHINVPYFFKQIDKIQPIPTDLQVRQFPNSSGNIEEKTDLLK